MNPTLQNRPLSEAWNRTAGTRWAGFFLMLLAMIPFVLIFYDLAHGELLKEAQPGWHVLLDFVLLWVSSLAAQAMARLGLARARGELYSVSQLFIPNTQTVSIFSGRLINYFITLIAVFFILCCSLLVMFLIGKLVGSLLLIVCGLPLLVCSATTDTFIALAIQTREARFYNAWLVALKQAKTYHLKTIGYVLLTLIFSMIGFFCAFIGLMWALPFNANLLTIVYLGQTQRETPSL